ncbi:MAG: hypothetical protein HQL07_03260 [Nitrospirae bacterium]|nr:hypothetical protein [Magnetococcales bacterium]
MDNQITKEPTAPSYQTIPLAFLSPPIEAKEIDLQQYWQILARGKWLILIMTVLSTAWSVYQAKTATPVYRAEVLITAVGEQQGPSFGGGLSGLASIAGLSIGGPSGSGSNLAIFQSRSFLEKFITDEKVAEILNGNKPSAAKDSGGGEKSPSADTLLWNTVDAFKGLITISTERKDGIIAVSVEWHDRHQAAKWANLLVQRLNDHLRNLAIQEAEKSIEFLNNELAKTQVTQLRQALANLLETQIQKIMMSKIRPEFAYSTVDPAIAPPEGMFVKPKRKQMVMIGFVWGVVLGSLTAVLFHLLRRKRNPAGTDD